MYTKMFGPAKPLDYTGVFSKWKENLVNLENLINHWSMNWSQFKDHVIHQCLAGAVLVSLSCTLDAAGSNHFNDKYYSHWI